MRAVYYEISTKLLNTLRRQNIILCIKLGGICGYDRASLYHVFFWVIPRRLGSNGRRFGTLSVPSSWEWKMEPIEGSETSAIRAKTPRNYPKENILHIEHGESLKSRILYTIFSQSVFVTR